MATFQEKLILECWKSALLPSKIYQSICANYCKFTCSLLNLETFLVIKLKCLIHICTGSSKTIVSKNFNGLFNPFRDQLKLGSPYGSDMDWLLKKIYQLKDVSMAIIIAIT